ncbi:MAG TPA: adenosine kinase [Rhizomicrobium sp.]|jgi:sugar/nucleoside kinase (ribokinase family)|nr:adenosine kinase [Rhizomicrobium sp.]
MEPAKIDVVGIGNAIVDIIAHADDTFLTRHKMQKGSMTLIDEGKAEALYAAMGPAMQLSGGSAANTIAGLASLGARTGYIGKVKEDALGRVFRHDIRSAGVRFPTEAATDGPATARCLIFVTPDAQRTMNTFLGASANLSPADVDEELIRSANIVYLEGYLYDPPLAKAAFHRAAQMAHGAGRKVALSLSDRFCVERYREEFRHLAELHIDYLFANESEIEALFETDVKSALPQVVSAVEIAAITHGAQGSLIATKGACIHIDAAPVERVVDTTGAGDLYAAGFLFGLARGRSLPECGRFGSLAAAEIISHYGGRPETPLNEYVQQRARAPEKRA